MSTFARRAAVTLTVPTILAASLLAPAPAPAPVLVLPDWSAASGPCPAGRALFDTEQVGMPASSGIEADGLACR